MRLGAGTGCSTVALITACMPKKNTIYYQHRIAQLLKFSTASFISISYLHVYASSPLYRNLLLSFETHAHLQLPICCTHSLSVKASAIATIAIQLSEFSAGCINFNLQRSGNLNISALLYHSPNQSDVCLSAHMHVRCKC